MVRHLLTPELIELSLNYLPMGMLTTLAFTRSMLCQPRPKRQILLLQYVPHLITSALRLPVFLGLLGLLIFLRLLTAEEVAPFREVVKGAAQLMGRQRTADSTATQLIGICLHQLVPFRRIKRRQQARCKQLFVEFTPPLATPPQLATHHAFQTPLLVERCPIGIARFGKNPHAHPLDAALFNRCIVLNHRPADRGGADVKAEDLLHLEISAGRWLANQPKNDYKIKCSKSRGGRFSQANRPLVRAQRPKVNPLASSTPGLRGFVVGISASIRLRCDRHHVGLRACTRSGNEGSCV